MAGASRAHIRIVKNLTVALDQRLSESCDVASTDLRVFIPSTGLYTYPDLVVTSGKEEFADTESDTLLNPLVIIEVLSKATQEYDWGLKFASYRTIQSLREYVTIAQDSARAECWRKRPNGDWTLTEYSGLDAAIALEAVAVELPMTEIYRKVDLSSS